MGQHFSSSAGYDSRDFEKCLEDAIGADLISNAYDWHKAQLNAEPESKGVEVDGRGELSVSGGGVSLDRGIEQVQAGLGAKKEEFLRKLEAEVSKTLRKPPSSAGAPIGAVAKKLSSMVPDVRGKKGKGKETFTKASDSQAKVCRAIAEAVNKLTGRVSISTDGSPGEICNKTFEVVQALIYGLHTDFLALSADIDRATQNIEAMTKIVTSLVKKASEHLEKVAENEEPEKKMQITQIKEIQEVALNELKRQQTILASLAGGVIQPSHKPLIRALKENQDLGKIYRAIQGNSSLGSEELSEKMSYLMAGVSPAGEILAVLEKLFKDAGLKINDYKNTPDFSALKKKLYDQFHARGKSTIGELNALMKALELIQKNQYRHSEIAKLVKGSFEPGIFDNEVSGGAQKSRLETYMKQKKEVQTTLIKDFSRQLKTQYSVMIYSIKKLIPLIIKGSIMPVGDFDEFIKSLDIDNFDRKKIAHALTGFTIDIGSVQLRSRFMNQLKYTRKVATKMEGKGGPTASMFREMAKAIDGILELTDKMTDIVQRPKGDVVEMGNVDGEDGLKRVGDDVVNVYGADEEAKQSWKEKMVAKLEAAKEAGKRTAMKVGDAIVENVPQELKNKIAEEMEAVEKLADSLESALTSDEAGAEYEEISVSTLKESVLEMLKGVDPEKILEDLMSDVKKLSGDISGKMKEASESMKENAIAGLAVYGQLIGEITKAVDNIQKSLEDVLKSVKEITARPGGPPAAAVELVGSWLSKLVPGIVTVVATKAEQVTESQPESSVQGLAKQAFTTLKNAAQSFKPVAGRGEFATGGEEEFAVGGTLNMPDVRKLLVSALEFEDIRRKLRNVYLLARMKRNVGRTAGEIKGYSKGYEKRLGKYVARLRNKADAEYKKLADWLDNAATLTSKDGVVVGARTATTISGSDSLPNGDPGERATAGAIDDFQDLDAPAKRRLKDLFKKQLDARHHLLDVVESLEAYLVEFSQGIVSNPEDLDKLPTILDSINYIHQWFNKKSGNRIADVFEQFPTALGAGVLVHHPPADLDGFASDRHYLTSLGAKLPGNPFLPIAPSEGHLSNLGNKLQDGLKSNSAFTNLMSSFTYIGQILGGKNLTNSLNVSPSTMKKYLEEYMAYGTLTFGGAVSHQFTHQVCLSAKNLSDAMVAATGNYLPGDLYSRKRNPANNQPLELDVFQPGQPQLIIPKQNGDAVPPANLTFQAYAHGFGRSGAVTGGDEKEKEEKKREEDILDMPDEEDDLPVGPPPKALAPAGPAPAPFNRDAEMAYSRAQRTLADGQIVPFEANNPADRSLMILNLWVPANLRHWGVRLQPTSSQGIEGAADRTNPMWDKIFVNVIKAMTAKILVSVKTYGLFNRVPSNVMIEQLSPLRTILGGAESGTPTIHEDCVELYVRLPMLAEFYRDVLYEEPMRRADDTENNFVKFVLLPEVQSIWSDFIKTIFVDAKNIKHGGYGDHHLRLIISQINQVYGEYKKKLGSKCTPEEIILGFVAEVNRRFGLIHQKDINLYLQIMREKYDGPRVEDKPNKADRVDFDVLPGDHEEDDWNRPGPSKAFTTNPRPGADSADSGERFRELPLTLGPDRHRDLDDKHILEPERWDDLAEKLDYRGDGSEEQDELVPGLIIRNFRKRIQDKISEAFGGAIPKSVAVDDRLRALIGRENRDDALLVYIQQLRNIKKEVSEAKDATAKYHVLSKYIQGDTPFSSDSTGRAMAFNDLIVQPLELLVQCYGLLDEHRNIIGEIYTMDKESALSKDILLHIKEGNVDAINRSSEYRSFPGVVNRAPAGLNENSLDEDAGVLQNIARFHGMGRFAASVGAIHLASSYVAGRDPGARLDFAEQQRRVNAGNATPEQKMERVRQYMFPRGRAFFALMKHVMTLTAETGGLIQVKIVGKKLMVDTTAFVDMTQKLYSQVKSNLELFRGRVQGSLIDRYEKSENAGSIYWLERHLMRGLIRGEFENQTTKELSVRGLGTVQDQLIKLFSPSGIFFSNYGGDRDSWENILSSMVMQGHTNCLSIAPGDAGAEVPVLLGHLDGYMPEFGNIGANGFINMIAGSPLREDFRMHELLRNEYADAKGEAYLPAGADAPAWIGQTVADTRANLSKPMSIVHKLNVAAMAYIRLLRDPSNKKIYLPLIDKFMSGFADLQGMSGSFSQADRFHEVGEKVHAVVHTSVLDYYKNVLEHTQYKTNIKQLLYETLSEVPTHVKHMYRVNLPLFQNIFQILLTKLELIEQIVEQMALEHMDALPEVGNQMLPTLVIRADGKDQGRNPGNAAGGALPPNYAHVGANTDRKSHLISIIGNAKKFARIFLQMSGTVLRELGTKLKYFESYPGSTSDLQSQNG